MKGCAVDIQHRFLILKECVIETRYWVVEICIFFFVMRVRVLEKVWTCTK